MRGSLRTSRVGEMMKAEIADILAKKVKDPRVGLATITGVTVTADLRHARVFFTALSDESHHHGTLEGLERAAGFIRSELARRLRIRRIPELTFEQDATIRRIDRVMTLLDDLTG